MCDIQVNCQGCSCHISPPCWHCVQGHELSVAERIELGYDERECGHRVGYTPVYKMLVCPTCAKDILRYGGCNKT